MIPPEVHAGALSDAASKPPFVEKAQLAGAKPQKKPGVDRVMPVDERGQIIIGQAFHKRLEFLEKEMVIQEIL